MVHVPREESKVAQLTAAHELFCLAGCQAEGRTGGLVAAVPLLNVLLDFVQACLPASIANQEPATLHNRLFVFCGGGGGGGGRGRGGGGRECKKKA